MPAVIGGKAGMADREFLAQSPQAPKRLMKQVANGARTGRAVRTDGGQKSE